MAQDSHRRTLFADDEAESNDAAAGRAKRHDSFAALSSTHTSTALQGLVVTESFAKAPSDVRHRGVLYKKGRVRHNWQKRRVQLHWNRIVWYHLPPSRSPLRPRRRPRPPALTESRHGPESGDDDTKDTSRTHSSQHTHNDHSPGREPLGPAKGALLLSPYSIVQREAEACAATHKRSKMRDKHGFEVVGTDEKTGKTRVLQLSSDTYDDAEIWMRAVRGVVEGMAAAVAGGTRRGEGDGDGGGGVGSGGGGGSGSDGSGGGQDGDGESGWKGVVDRNRRSIANSGDDGSLLNTEEGRRRRRKEESGHMNPNSHGQQQQQQQQQRGGMHGTSLAQVATQVRLVTKWRTKTVAKHRKLLVCVGFSVAVVLLWLLLAFLGNIKNWMGDDRPS